MGGSVVVAAAPQFTYAVPVEAHTEKPFTGHAILEFAVVQDMTACGVPAKATPVQ